MTDPCWCLIVMDGQVHLRVQQLLQRRLLEESFNRGQQDSMRRISGGKEVLPVARGGESLDGPAGDQPLTVSPTRICVVAQVLLPGQGP